MRWLPVQWPLRQSETEPQQRFFAGGGFFTGDRKARWWRGNPALRTGISTERPLRLNTGRIRDQWHTMTCSGISPRLGQHMAEPFVEIHPDDASRFGVVDGGFARIATDYGQCVLKVVVSERQQRGMLFAPIHWSSRDSIRRAGRRAGCPVHRSALGPTRKQGHPGVNCAI